jgi:hypothetical protein
MSEPKIAAPDDPRTIATRDVFKRLNEDPALDPQTRYSVCLQAAGNFLARDLAGDPSPAIRAAIGIIANAHQEALRANPEWVAKKRAMSAPAAGKA